ncbi:MAG: 4Fe-4S binding protein, partial [Anaerolineae bacterium]
VWLGIGPGDKLMTICHCCPCCCLWRMLPDLAPEIGAKTMGMPGVMVQVDEECVGCGTCTEGVCFVDAIRLEDGRAVIGDACRGCGRCVEICPQDAIKLSLEHAEAVDEAVRQLSTRVQVS